MIKNIGKKRNPIQDSVCVEYSNYSEEINYHLTFISYLK